MIASEIVFALAIAPLWGGVLWLLVQHRRCRADIDLHSSVTSELDRLQSRARIQLVDVGKRIEEVGSRIPSGVVTDEYLRRVFDVILGRLQEALECDQARPAELGNGDG